MTFFRFGFLLSLCSTIAFVCSWQVVYFKPTVVMQQYYLNSGTVKRNISNITELEATRETLAENVDEEIEENFELRKCDKPVSTFVFLRTHKTGSTTLRAFLHGYVDRYKFSKYMAWHHPWPYSAGYPGLFKCKYMVPKGSLINTQHTRFNPEEMKKCFNNDTRYFTILRRPWENFLSTYFYFRDKQSFLVGCDGMPKVYIKQGRTMSTGQFLAEAATLLKPEIPFYFRFRNFQSHNLGIDAMLTDEDEIKRQIEDIDKNMHLVMLLEYLDESLILMKELLCFDWDVLSKYEHKNSRKYTPTMMKDDEERKNFEHLYNIDLMLYDHFNKTFWKRVDAYGREKMAENLKILRSKRKARKKRSIWPAKLLKVGVTMKHELELELQEYMNNHSGKCYYPRRNPMPAGSIPVETVVTNPKPGLNSSKNRSYESKTWFNYTEYCSNKVNTGCTAINKCSNKSKAWFKSTKNCSYKSETEFKYNQLCSNNSKASIKSTKTQKIC
uniref:Galactose-3-O-sulfotransferase 3 n=1 Tax=Phallusia mammillata TaxID=59560 RepID=A0A6F9DCS6_9ASCI|nr:galactose-3-O-sulfotransferase 3 [Phallusia mammillata]